MLVAVAALARSALGQNSSPVVIDDTLESTPEGGNVTIGFVRDPTIGNNACRRVARAMVIAQTSATVTSLSIAVIPPPATQVCAMLICLMPVGTQVPIGLCYNDAFTQTANSGQVHIDIAAAQVGWHLNPGQYFLSMESSTFTYSLVSGPAGSYYVQTNNPCRVHLPVGISVNDSASRGISLQRGPPNTGCESVSPNRWVGLPDFGAGATLQFKLTGAAPSPTPSMPPRPSASALHTPTATATATQSAAGAEGAAQASKSATADGSNTTWATIADVAIGFAVVCCVGIIGACFYMKQMKGQLNAVVSSRAPDWQGGLPPVPQPGHGPASGATVILGPSGGGWQGWVNPPGTAEQPPPGYWPRNYGPAGGSGSFYPQPHSGYPSFGGAIPSNPTAVPGGGQMQMAQSVARTPSEPVIISNAARDSHMSSRPATSAATSSSSVRRMSAIAGAVRVPNPLLALQAGGHHSNVSVSGSGGVQVPGCATAVAGDDTSRPAAAAHIVREFPPQLARE